jgi:hypothetical protein
MKAEQKYDPIQKVIWSSETDDPSFIQMKAQNEKKGFFDFNFYFFKKDGGVRFRSGLGWERQ